MASQITGNPAADAWTLGGNALADGVYVRGNANYAYATYSTAITIGSGSNLVIDDGLEPLLHTFLPPDHLILPPLVLLHLRDHRRHHPVDPRIHPRLVTSLHFGIRLRPRGLESPVASHLHHLHPFGLHDLPQTLLAHRHVPDTSGILRRTGKVLHNPHPAEHLLGTR